MDYFFWLKIMLNLFELVAFITGILYWNEVRNSFWKWFVVYCGIVFLTEVSGKLIGYGLQNPALNANLYFFFGIPVQVLFFFWFFYQWFERKNDKLIPLIGVFIYIAAWVVELLFLREKKMWFSSFSYLIGNVIIFQMLLVCFFRFVNSNEVLYYKRSRIFWVGTGMLLFYTGTLPFYGLRNYWYFNYKEVFYPYWAATYILGSLMYLFFAFAFIWGKQK